MRVAHFYRALKPRSSNLAFDAQLRWGSRHCPCCGRAMHTREHRPGRPQPRDARTRGHDVPVSLGGVAWIYICFGCNNDQGSLPFAVWARKLAAAGDARAPLVQAVAEFIEERRQDRDR